VAADVPLVLVATPIGNLGDLSPRAAEALAGADCVCCEDTRRTGRLFQLAGIERRAPFIRVDDHTEAARVPEVLDRLRRGERVVVVTDAGTPGVADPGERLVAAAVAAGLPVEVVPGPSAAVTALVVSGLPTGRWVFEGFLPRKGSARRERLAELAGERRTIVLYEAPHRAGRTLADLAGALGADRRVAVGRELTKLHEEVLRCTLSEAAAWAVAREPVGELVFVVEGAPPPAAATANDVEAAVAAALAEGLSPRDAAARVASALGVPKRDAYRAATPNPTSNSRSERSRKGPD
jgi:16S rRNA (cytidine1402-2'-O)-methyltransferase